MMFKETVIAGAENPGTQPEVMQSAAGYYIGYRDEVGMPYSRETDYFADPFEAEENLARFNAALAVSINEARKLQFVRA